MIENFLGWLTVYKIKLIGACQKYTTDGYKGNDYFELQKPTNLLS